MPEKKYPPLKVHKERPPDISGYSWIGFYKTYEAAEKWFLAALKAGKNYPFWLQKSDIPAIYGKNTYSLWWKKPKSGKLAGKGFVDGNRQASKK